MSSNFDSSNPFSVGAVFSQSWDIFTRAFGKFLVLALIPMSPLLVLNFIPGAVYQAGEPRQAFTWIMGLGIVLAVALDAVNRATVLYGTLQEIKGETFSIGESLSVGFNRLFPVFGVGLVAGILVGLASILFLVPGLIVLCMLYVAVPVCVIEKHGVFDSLGRSRALSKGYRWQIFGMLVVIFIVTAVLSVVVSYLTGLSGSKIIIVLADFLVRTLAGAFGSIVSGVAYRDLRLTKEGIDTSKIANIFS